MSRRLAFLVLLSSVWPQSGFCQITITYLGQTLPEADVCFYRYDIDNPYLGFEGKSYKCFPTGGVDAVQAPFLPSAFFFRSGTDLIGQYHHPFRSKGPQLPYVRMNSEVVAAGHLDLSAFKTAPEDHLSIVLIETADGPLIVRPVNDRASEPVPANRPVLVALVHGNRPVAVSTLATSDRYALKRVPDFRQNGVFVRFTVEGGIENLRLSRERLTNVLVPDVVLIDEKSATHSPLWKARTPQTMNGMLYFFPDVPAGPAELRVSGSGWKPVRQRVEVRSGVTVVEKEIDLRFSGPVN